LGSGDLRSLKGEIERGLFLEAENKYKSPSCVVFDGNPVVGYSKKAVSALFWSAVL
jgi:hypothetical protein